MSTSSFDRHQAEPSIGGRDLPALGQLLFRFAVIADTHVTEQEGNSSSPWQVNKLANARCRNVVSQINRAEPAFVLHLGDLVHPVPAQATFGDAAQRFHELMSELKCDLHLTAGNHDVGDKPLDWMPAGTVNESYIGMYEEHFGKHFYSFDSDGVHFVVINAQIINSGLPSEAVQREWLESDLLACDGRRIFLCTHYPPYVTSANEPSSYDNIDEPGRSWLLELLAKFKVEAVFAGHVHNFWYDRRGETELYILPSTAFVRQDYSELFRIEPEADLENGRDDKPKLGYLLVDVHERGHVAHTVRSFGEVNDQSVAVTAEPSRLPLVHTKTIKSAPVGLDLRHPWAEIVEVAASGGVDEFERKLVRNDYPVMALWEMGVRKLRIPLHDLFDAGTRERMRILARMGHGFTAYSYDVPSGALLDKLVQHSDLLVAWELVIAWDKALDRLDRVAAVKRACPGLRIIWSKLRSHHDAKPAGVRYSHMISHGFTLSDSGTMEQFLKNPLARQAVDAFALRIAREDSPWDGIHAGRALSSVLGVGIAIQVRLAASTPGILADDDATVANRVADTMMAAFAGPDIDVFFDTFNDVDRSFFARLGLVDRRYNPRLAGAVYRNINALMSQSTEQVIPLEHQLGRGEGVVRMLACGSDVWHLVLADAQTVIDVLHTPSDAIAQSGTCRDVDLETGVITAKTWHHTDGGQVRLDQPIHCRGLRLIQLVGALAPPSVTAISTR